MHTYHLQPVPIRPMCSGWHLLHKRIAITYIRADLLSLQCLSANLRQHFHPRFRIPRLLCGAIWQLVRCLRSIFIHITGLAPSVALRLCIRIQVRFRCGARAMRGVSPAAMLQTHTMKQICFVRIASTMAYLVSLMQSARQFLPVVLYAMSALVM